MGYEAGGQLGGNRGEVSQGVKCTSKASERKGLDSGRKWAQIEGWRVGREGGAKSIEWWSV